MQLFILVFALSVLVSGLIALILALREFTKMLGETEPDSPAHGTDAESATKPNTTQP